jgi:hypothetical protein
MKLLMIGIKNILLWSYGRGSWQYDILCLLIIATIFIVPSSYFGDRDRRAAPRANQSAEIASKDQIKIREILVDELQSFLQRQNRFDLMKSPKEAITLYLRDQNRHEISEISDLEPFMTSQGRPAYRVRFK